MNTSFSQKKSRFWEVFPFALSISVLLGPILLSLYFPKTAAAFILLYTLLWFLLALEYSGFLLYAFYKSRQARKMDWQKKLQALEDGTHLSPQEGQMRENLKSDGDWIAPGIVQHLVIIATCGESIDILRETVRAILDSNYDTQKIMLCLATEKRMHTSGSHNAGIIQREFGSQFRRFFWTEHPDGLPGEVRGKGGNITHAGREIQKKFIREDIESDSILVTTLDADNRVDKEYFSALTYHFCLQENRYHKSYQPTALFYNNIWDVPILNRMASLATGYWIMIESGRLDRLRNFASHAQPWKALRAMDFWATDTIVEDGRHFWRSYLHFHGDYEVVPIFIPIYQDAVLNTNYYRSLVGQYKQIRRWAWGCSDIPFCVRNFHKMRAVLPFGKTFLHFTRLIYLHVMWATVAPFIVFARPALSGINVSFQQTTLASNMTHLLEIFFSVALIGILLSMAVSLLTLPKAPSVGKRLSLVWQWALLPIGTIALGSLPALEAQFRLAFNMPLEFNVTKKVRIYK